MKETTKETLYTLCQQQVEDRIMTLKQAIKSAQQAANEETKSSAGDKYETTRAMMQIEKDNHNKQLSEVLKLKKVLDQLDPTKASAKAELGSLVQTDAATYYLAVSAGKLTVEGTDYFVISPVSPIGKLLVGKAAGDTFSFQNKSFKILTVE